MSAGAARALRSRAGSGAGALLSGTLLGVALVVLCARLGPIGMVAVPVAGLAAAAVLSRPVLGLGLVVLSIPFGLRPVPGGLVAVQAVVLVVVALVVLQRLAAKSPPLAWAPPLWFALGLLVWAVGGNPASP